MGDKSGQVPLDKLADHIRKLPEVLQADQITDVKQRLRALDAVRPTIPVPKGPMPTRTRQVKGARQPCAGGRQGCLPGPRVMVRPGQRRAGSARVSHRTLLDGVSVGIGTSEGIGVVGRNGDGKTSLLRLLTRDLDLYAGPVVRTG